MARDILIGVDAGTSVIKAVAFSTDGVILAVAARTNSYAMPSPGAVEQDMARTWVDTAAVLKDLGERVPNLVGRLAAIAVTAQGDGTWLIDADGEPVCPAWLWLDSRAADIADDLARAPSNDRQYALTGTGINACAQPVHLRWMKKHRPEVLARATTAFHCKDWLYFKLTGIRATDPSEALYNYGDFRTRAYVPDLLEGLGLADCERLLPPIVDGTQVAGALSASAAALTGLPAGTPVMLGYIDVVMSGMGGGLFSATGDVGCTILGSTGMQMRYTPDARQAVLNPMRSGYTMAFPVPGAVAQMQSSMAATLNIDWLLDIGRDVLAMAGVEKSRKDLLVGMDERVMGAPAAGVLYHPYIFEAGERGPFLDPNARAQFIGLSTRVGYAGLMRAVYEGLALAARDCYAAMGPLPAEIRVAGGAARSGAIRAILSSVLQAKVRIVEREESGAAGVAMMAAVCLGLYPDMAACNAAWIEPHLGAATEPDPGLKGIYDEAFGVYQTVRQLMPPAWSRLAAMRREGP